MKKHQQNRMHRIASAVRSLGPRQLSVALVMAIAVTAAVSTFASGNTAAVTVTSYRELESRHGDPSDYDPGRISDYERSNRTPANTLNKSGLGQIGFNYKCYFKRTQQNRNPGSKAGSYSTGDDARGVLKISFPRGTKNANCYIDMPARPDSNKDPNDGYYKMFYDSSHEPRSYPAGVYWWRWEFDIDLGKKRSPNFEYYWCDSICIYKGR